MSELLHDQMTELKKCIAGAMRVMLHDQMIELKKCIADRKNAWKEQEQNRKWHRIRSLPNGMSRSTSGSEGLRSIT